MVIIRDTTERKMAEERIVIQYDLSSSLLSVKSLNEIISLCFEKAIQLSGMDCGLLYLVDEESGDYICRQHMGVSHECLAIASHLNAASECASCLHNMVPMYGKAENICPSMNHISKKEGFKSVALIPILYDNTVIGCYFLASHKFNDLPQTNRYSLETIAALGGFAIGRIKAEIAIKESKDFSSSLINKFPNPILVIKPDTSIEYVNPALEKLTGFTLEELAGKKSPYPWWPEQYQKKIIKTSEYAVSKGTCKAEILFQKKNGDHFWVEVSSTPVIRDGQFLYSLSNWVDITDRKRAQKELDNYKEHLEELVKKRTQKIRTLEEQRQGIESLVYSGQVAARVAHEINNPLAGIKNSFLLIKDAVSPDHPYHHYMGLIEKEINRLACIVKQIFGLYQPELITRKAFELQDLINDIIELLESTRREHDVNIVVSTKPVYITNIPESLLRQILYNIFINAMEASDSCGEIIIRSKVEDKNILISVEDHGRGIPDEIKPHIFDSFYSTKTEDHKGLGLGLSITKKIVDELRGTISFETKPGSGTVFTIDLPMI